MAYLPSMCWPSSSSTLVRLFCLFHQKKTNQYSGPNTTTFIVPGEVFPTRYRSTSHGISAASGKIGSIIGQGAISVLRTRGATATNEAPWLNHVLEIYALFMLLGCLTTMLIPETKRKTLEELTGEDDYAAKPDASVNMESESFKGGKQIL